MMRIQRLGVFLEAHFGEVEYHMPEEPEGEEPEEDIERGESALPPHTTAEPSFLIQLDEADARINLISMVRIAAIPFRVMYSTPLSFCLLEDDGHPLMRSI